MNAAALCQQEASAKAGCSTDNLLMPLPFVLLKVSPKRNTEDHPEGSCISEAPGSCHKKPERQSAITYDYSEEELMASIEREYCC